MKKHRINIPVSRLRINSGQVEGLPKNPRQWTQYDIDRTAKSIEEDPDFLEDRPLLVIADKGAFVVFAGNLRLTAAKKLDMKELPCVQYEPESDGDVETIIRRALKDNGSFGSWDYDELANSWGDYPLGDWGIPSWINNVVNDVDEDNLLEKLSIDTDNSPGESQTGYKQITFVFRIEDSEIVDNYIKEHGKESLSEKIVELCQPAEVK